jgi:uncharacterized membrane protein (DUF485 family)
MEPLTSPTREALMTDIVGEPQTDYQRVQNSEEFQALKRRFRRFVFPMTAFFLAWYFLYVLLADYAHDFMSTKVWGNVNVGLLLGLGQFVSTFAITMIYARWANNRQDPVAEQLRLHIENGDPLDGGRA